jgi:ABC-type phosphate transport system substrate-binding protein
MRNKTFRWFALATVLGCWAFQHSSQAQGLESLVVVVNKTNAAANLSKSDARKLLLGDTSSWPNGSKVLVILRSAGSPERAAALKKVCGMTESEYTRYELQVSFTGRTAATVREAPSAAAIKAQVKANPGAVGILRKGDADEDVKVVLTLD